MLGDAGMTALAEFLEVDRKLKYLDIHANQVSDQGIKVFAKAVEQAVALKAFDATANDTTEDGEKALVSAVQKNGNVQSLTGEERMAQFESMCIVS